METKITENFVNTEEIHQALIDVVFDKLKLKPTQDTGISDNNCFSITFGRGNKMFSVDYKLLFERTSSVSSHEPIAYGEFIFDIISPDCKDYDLFLEDVEGDLYEQYQRVLKLLRFNLIAARKLTSICEINIPGTRLSRFVTISELAHAHLTPELLKKRIDEILSVRESARQIFLGMISVDAEYDTNPETPTPKKQGRRK